MTFQPSFPIGTVITNSQLQKEFSCGNSGGMRRSQKNHCLVIISDHTKSKYIDQWDGDVLQYTGMGLTGDQSIDYMQNKTLAESRTNGVTVYLFEVDIKNQYCYEGIVQLCKDPYRSRQKDANGNEREVVIFPVQLRNERPPIDEEIYQRSTAEQTRKARKLSDEELYEIAKEHSKKSVLRRVTSSPQYERDPYVAENAKRRAKGICQLCGKPAPFLDRQGQPYLETHHIKWLSRGGADTIENTAALCPNCHRKMHIIDSKTDIEKLNKIMNKESL